MSKLLPVFKIPVDSELKRLGDHHLDTDALIGMGLIDADHNAFGPGSDSHTQSIIVNTNQQDSTRKKLAYHGSHMLKSSLTSCNRRQLMLSLTTVKKPFY